MQNSAFVLIFDPDEARGDALREVLRSEKNYPCLLVTTLEAAQQSIINRAPDVMVARADRDPRVIDSIADALEENAPDAGLVAIGVTEIEGPSADQFAPLPADTPSPKILEKIGIVARQAVSRREDRMLQESASKHAYEVFDGIVGESPAMHRIIERIKKVAAKGKMTVLIIGETGTGKDLIAESIHKRSPRAKKPFVAVNCAAFTESLLESQLFGHVKGAFTGAFADQKGIFAAADGGTIFLDEIGDMPLHLQTKLLRVLERREFTPVGSTEVRRVDVRIIAATNAELLEKVEAGEFRADLYYRLHHWEIAVPPLRARRQDIPLLAHHFLAKANEDQDTDVESISSEAMLALTRYYWPGNVRELRNLFDALVIEVETGTIGMEDLPEQIRGKRDLVPVNQTPLVGMTIADVERLMIERTLDHTEGNREQAAKMLGIGTRTLYRKIKEYGL